MNCRILAIEPQYARHFGPYLMTITSCDHDHFCVSKFWATHDVDHKSYHSPYLPNHTIPYYGHYLQSKSLNKAPCIFISKSNDCNKQIFYLATADPYICAEVNLNKYVLGDVTKRIVNISEESCLDECLTAFMKHGFICKSANYFLDQECTLMSNLLPQ